MKTRILTAAALLLAFSGFAQNTDKLLDGYIGVKNAMVNSDGKAASEAIDAFYQSVKSEGNFSGKPELLKASDKLDKATNLENQRAAFNDVSTAMWKLVKNSDKATGDVYYQYCPMKKAYWLSKEKEIRNPYYGSAMLTCGKVTETKK